MHKGRAGTWMWARGERFCESNDLVAGLIGLTVSSLIDYEQENMILGPLCVSGDLPGHRQLLTSRHYMPSRSASVPCGSVYRRRGSNAFGWGNFKNFANWLPRTTLSTCLSRENCQKRMRRACSLGEWRTIGLVVRKTKVAGDSSQLLSRIVSLLISSHLAFPRRFVEELACSRIEWIPIC